MRLRSAGHAILSVEDALCRHRGGTPGISYRGGIDYPERRAFLHSRNRWLHLLKNHSARTLALTAPALLAYELVWMLFTLRSGTFGGYLRGKAALLGALQEVQRQRRDVQRRRTVRDRDLLVGGPLTVAPQLDRGGASSAALRALDHALEAWWRLVRSSC
jgi:hypothetical protein